MSLELFSLQTLPTEASVNVEVPASRVEDIKLKFE
jgi:hypothetical protein